MRLTIDGLAIHTEVCGEGPAVALFHGWGGSARSFGPLMEQLAAQGYRVAALDFPGHGESDPPPTPYSVTEYAGLTHRWMQALDMADCAVIAHSFGGRVAIHLAAEKNCFSRMILVGAAGVRPKRTLKHTMRVYRYKLGRRLAKNPWLDRRLGLSERAKNAGSADYRALSEEMKKTFVRVVNQDLRPMLRHIQAPALLVWGEEDKESPLYMARIMEREIPDAGLVLFKGAGHFCYLDQYARFFTVVKAFLQDAEGRRP